MSQTKDTDQSALDDSANTDGEEGKLEIHEEGDKEVADGDEKDGDAGDTLLGEA